MILGVCLLVQACFLRGPDASGTLEGAGGARGVLAVLKDASSWKAVASDTLGNVLALAGTNGDFQRRTFDPWGNPLVRDGSGSLRAATLNERRADYDALPLAWASQEVDPDTGLSHYHFREYSPSLGGWLTQDPIGLAGGYLNLRSYLGNRPADALDKEGRFAWVAPGAAIGGIIGGAFGAVVGAVDEYQTNPNASAWGLVKAGGKGLFVGAVAGAVVGSGVGLVAEVAVAGAGAAQAGLGAGGALTMAAHKANEVGIPQLIEAVGNPVPTAPVGAMVRTELGMAKAAGAEAKGAGQLGAKISVAANATARAAAQAEASTLDKVKLPCAEAARAAPTTAVQPYFPVNNGLLGATERHFLMPGQVITRYGGTASSRFFSPAGTSAAARALPAGSAGQPMRTFEVMKPFEVDAGTVAPAFGQPGLGTQFRTPVQLDFLLKRGILNETTP